MSFPPFQSLKLSDQNTTRWRGSVEREVSARVEGFGGKGRRDEVDEVHGMIHLSSPSFVRPLVRKGKGLNSRFTSLLGMPRKLTKLSFLSSWISSLFLFLLVPSCPDVSVDGASVEDARRGGGGVHQQQSRAVRRWRSTFPWARTARSHRMGSGCLVRPVCTCHRPRPLCR